MTLPHITKRLLCVPKPGCEWADKMVLNPAMIQSPDDPYTIHMLFRATGPWPKAQVPGKPLPYPIFLGYAVSHDAGETWDFDFSRPAMKPALKYTRDELFLDGTQINYANGCLEDPRLFYLEDELYLTVASRTFPPGPYWDHDDPVQCMPEWALGPNSGLGSAVEENATVTMLYRVNLRALAQHCYEEAFEVVGPLHNPNHSDDRDVMLFPRRLNINGKQQFVVLHRPKYPWRYEIGKNLKAPSIFIAAAESLEDFADDNLVEREVLATPKYPWEANRIGCSWAPFEIAPGEWLLPYHGKQDDIVGYTQSFMLLRENGTLHPEIMARPSERLLYATEDWELEGDFTIPCVFTCSGILLDNKLMMGYGAADQKVGLATIDFKELMAWLRG